MPQAGTGEPLLQEHNAKGSGKQGVWETLGRDQGWRETVMFYLGLVVTTLSRERFQTASGTSSNLSRQNLFLL